MATLTLRKNGVVDNFALKQKLAKRDAEAHRVASQAAKADPSDPFIYDRVFSHMIHGVDDGHQ